MPELFPPSLAEQIACVKREISMRELMYPRWVEQKKMAREKADKEIAAMKAVLESLTLFEPVAELRGRKPVVCYFASDEDRLEFIALVEEAKPGMVARKL